MEIITGISPFFFTFIIILVIALIVFISWKLIRDK